MNAARRKRRSIPWFIVGPLLPFCLAGLAYLAWSPGLEVLDGRHDKSGNGIWIGHGWLGDEGWFVRNGKDPAAFRDPKAIRELAERFARHGMRYVFPHCCPCSSSGAVAPIDAVQAERFLDAFAGFDVMPWIGGVLDKHCRLESIEWQSRFVASAVDLLQAHPRLAGLHVNIEPLPSGDPGYLRLLDELRRAMPAGKRLTVAAYPPPTWWHPFPEVHWDEDYYREVARRADLLAVMMYDTALKWRKIYCHLMADWTGEVLSWSEGADVLLGMPVYEDPGVEYHDPSIENLKNALTGIHAGLARLDALPENFEGIALYCAWEMDAAEWIHLERNFGRRD